MKRFQNVHCAFLKHVRIVVSVRAADINDVAFRRFIEYSFGLKLTDANIIERDVIVYI
ncbi:hypothetical protein D3C76_1501890 [compost metagenome]